MRWRSLWLAAVVAGAVVSAASAPAAPLTPSDQPLPGSRFQGADGNQLNEGGFIDWQAIRARVVHNHDANDEDTAFGGGTKETDPANWVIDTERGGVNPGKDNLREAWSAGDQPDGRTFLYLALTREDPSGTTFLTFELNQSGRTWVNDKDTRIPCRTDGDVLVSFEISGNTPKVTLYRWKRGATDAGSGCDRTGTIEPLGTVTADVEAQGAMNPAAIANSLPGAGAQIDALLFGEAALDLDSLLGPAFSDGCYAFGSVWLHSRSSTSMSSQMQDYVAPEPIDLRTCAASGAKFFDLDADGVRDPREPGLPGFQIYADYNGNGRLDPGEPSTVTDRHGDYVLNDIRREAYTLRERLLPTRRRALKLWLCSFPNASTDGGFGRVGLGFPCGWGPIETADEPYAKGRDFGNWYPAQLTVVKRLFPADDGGRFDLFVNGTRVFRGAGNGATRRLVVPPGAYTVSEQAVPPTDPGEYAVTASCKLRSRRARASASITLAAGQRGVCRIVNVRRGRPAIAIDKSGPSLAEAGDTLRYTLRVTNPGNVPFAAADVQVGDPSCDRPPQLTDKSDGSGPDTTPGTLDPGDVWTYTCSVDTDAPGGDCALRVVRNTATASGEAGGTTVEDSSTIDTTLTCPDTPPPDPPDPPDPPIPPDPPDPPVPPQPPDPIPPAPIVPDLPDVPSPVIPDVPAPPDAGTAGVAGLASLQSARCLTRLPRLRVRVRARQVSRVTVFVDGRQVAVIRGTPLQRRLTTRPLAGRGLAPGRHTIAARVRFRLGSGTRPLTLVRRVRICAVRLPRFTG